MAPITHLLEPTPVETICPGLTYDGLQTGVKVLRIEVKKDLEFNKPRVIVDIGWDCSTGTCSESCKIGATDADKIVDSALGLGHLLIDSVGKWAVFGHHWETRVDVVRAGSESSN